MIHLFLVLCACLAQAAMATAEVEITGRDSTHVFKAPPERVVTLDWALTEQVLDLGVAPVGAPELDLYEEWVGDPPLPASTADVGLRTEPNLERIAALTPDVILASDIDERQVRALERIAPTVVFKAYDAEHDNVEAARRIFLELAGLFDRTKLAERRLAEMERTLDRIARDVAALDVPGTATVIRLNDDSTVWIYGDNSFPTYALKRLGLSSEISLPRSRWGVTQKPLESLAEVESGALLAIRPHMGGAAAFEGPLWPALPAVRNGRFTEVPRVWSYGGILSLERHAGAFLSALEDLSE